MLALFLCRLQQSGTRPRTKNALQPAEMCYRIGRRTTMTSWQRIRAALDARLNTEERSILGLQLLVIFAISTLLYFGLPGTREWRRVAEESHMYTVMRAWDGLSWYVWLAAAPVMLLLIRRFPLTRSRIKRSLAGLALSSLGLYLVVTHVRYFLHVLPDLIWSSDRTWLLDSDTYAYNTFGLMPFDLLTYSSFFAVSFSLDYYFRHRHRVEEAKELQLKTAQLQTELARAELAALRGQLHPHFLFNSFNALATLVRQHKNDQAVEIIAQLSELLRMAIDRTGLHEIPLHQELEFIRRYLEIERLRYGEKLRTEFAVEAGASNALVPNIVLQPLVENAIKHAISLRTNPGLVRVSASRTGERLRVVVADDGPEHVAPAPETRKRPGIGLANSRAQLDKLYGSDYRLEVAKRPDGGTTIQLDLPWRLASEAALNL
jgi:two-component system LytT family sensor kinase